MKLFNKSKFFIMLLSLVVILAACGGNDNSDSEKADSGDAEDEVYTLKVATSLDTNNLMYAGYPIFKEKVEASGRVEIDYVGGPEAIPAYNQGEAVQNGVIDMAFIASAYYPELVPETLVTLYSELTYEEEIESGAIDYLSEMHEKMNAKYIGRIAQGDLVTYTTKKVETTEDFNGLKLRATPAYHPIYNALGVDVINMEGGEIYNGLERGLIDGTGWASYSITDLGVQEVVKYQIKPEYYKLDTSIIMNLDSWNELPEDVQEIITTASIEAYNEMGDVVEEAMKEEQKVLEEHGVETIELKDADKYLEIAQEEAWKWLGERVEDIDTLKEYFTK